MTPEDQLIEDLKHTNESAIRAELALHDLHPSDLISKEVLINMLVQTYFPID